MIGNNKLDFNEATMIEAVQQYLDREFKNPVKVQSIDLEKGMHTKTFIVRVGEPDIKASSLDEDLEEAHAKGRGSA